MSKPTNKKGTTNCAVKRNASKCLRMSLRIHPEAYSIIPRKRGSLDFYRMK